MLALAHLLSAANERPAHADQMEARLVWMHEEPLLPGRSYLLKTGSTIVTASFATATTLAF